MNLNARYHPLNLRPLRPERCYLLGNTNKTNDFRTALTTNIAVCSRGFGGQSVVGIFKPASRRAEGKRVEPLDTNEIAKGLRLQLLPRFHRGNPTGLLWRRRLLHGRGVGAAG